MGRNSERDNHGKARYSFLSSAGTAAEERKEENRESCLSSGQDTRQLQDGTAGWKAYWSENAQFKGREV